MRIAASGRVKANPVGGNTRYLAELESALAQLSVHYDVLTAATWSTLPGKPGMAYAAQESAWPFTLAGNYDVLHYPNDTGPLTRGAIPIVGTVHGMASRHIPNVRHRLGEAVWRARVKRLIDASHEIITVSSTSKTDIVEEFDVPSQRITVIPHGIDHSRFHPDSSSDHLLLDLLPLPDKFVLYLGNLDPRKNVNSLLAAVNVLNDSGKRTHLVVAGAPAWGADSSLKIMRDSRHVTYLGRVSDDLVAPLLRRATAFVFPSLYEGFGFPVLEAMACGTPVICSHRGSLAEVAGDAGLTVDPLNVGEICRSISCVLDSTSRANELSIKGKINAAKYNWSASAQSHRQVFERVAST